MNRRQLAETRFREHLAALRRQQLLTEVERELERRRNIPLHELSLDEVRERAVLIREDAAAELVGKPHMAAPPPIAPPAAPDKPLHTLCTDELHAYADALWSAALPKH